jgi:hypothetical protein
MIEFWKIVQVILLSSVKFVAGPAFAYYNQQHSFSLPETVIYCVIGGMLGVVVFSYLSKPFFIFEHWLFRKYRKWKQKPRIFSKPKVDLDGDFTVNYEFIDKENAKRKVFTKRNRRVVQIWKKYGLTGIAIITPIILSIPIGTIIANSLEVKKSKILLYMFFSILFWSVAMTTVFEILHIASLKDLQEQVIP